MFLVKENHKSHLLLPSNFKKNSEFKISSHLNKTLIFSNYNSINDIEEISVSERIDLIILYEKMYGRWSKNRIFNPNIYTIVIGSDNSDQFFEKNTGFFEWIPFDNFFNLHLNNSLEKCLANIELRRENEFLKSRVLRQENSFKELHDIGIALSEEKNINHLLEKIISKSMQLTYADGGL